MRFLEPPPFTLSFVYKTEDAANSPARANHDLSGVQYLGSGFNA